MKRDEMSKMKHLGTIQIDVSHVRRVKGANPVGAPKWDEHRNDIVSEKALKGRTISHCVE